jgi:hypothetical protein
METRTYRHSQTQSRARCAALLKLGLASHQDALHLLGCFKFKILAQIAIRPGERDFLVFSGIFTLQVLRIRPFAFQAAPETINAAAFPVHRL